MKNIQWLKSLLIAAFFVTTANAEQSNLEKSYILSLANSNFQLVRSELDTKRFFGARMILRVSNLTDDSFSALILNDICPKVPGKVTCMAMPYPLISADFKLKSAKVDSCGVITRESNVANYVTNFNEKETARVKIRDYRFSTCDVLYVSDLEVELNLKRKKGSSQSNFWLNFVTAE